MKENNKTTGNSFAAVRNNLLKPIIRNVKAEYKKRFTIEEFSKLIAFGLSFYIVLKITEIWVPLRVFLIEHGREALEALITYLITYFIIYIFIYVSVSVVVGVLKAIFQHFFSIKK
jgi:uncharacterized Tic20 family protein